MKAGITLIGIVAVLAAVGCAGDSVTATGGDGTEVGILVDGTNAGTFHNDDRGTGPDGFVIAVTFGAGPARAVKKTSP
jgi:hypothetical protein